MQSEELAKRIRIHAIEMAHAAHASHIGSVLSVVDIIAVLYADILRFDPKNPKDPSRDRFVLSKGHAGIAVYAVLAESGFFPIAELKRYYQNGSPYSGHVSHANVPGVEFSTGSLGHGAGVACGMALSAKLRGENHRVFAVVGDGECNEGEIWEMASVASAWNLSNFVVIVDHNHMQALGRFEEVNGPSPLHEKWKSFGWNVSVVEDGNNHDQLRKAFLQGSRISPTCIVANTVKGKGVSFMEHELLWHYRDPQGEFYEKAMAELAGRNS